MTHNRYSLFFLVIIFAFALSGCGSKKITCPPAEGTPQTAPRLADLIESPPPASAPSRPIQVVIGGRETVVDKLVDYPLCNDNWSGTVYVSCNVQVAEAEKDAESTPLFLKGCNLNIAPNTVVYVAAHNDTPYYNGCSCHTGQKP